MCDRDPYNLKMMESSLRNMPCVKVKIEPKVENVCEMDNLKVMESSPRNMPPVKVKIEPKLEPKVEQMDYNNEDVTSMFNYTNSKMISETIVCTRRRYIMHMSGTLESCPNVIISLSDNTSEIYKLDNNHLAKLHTFKVSDRIVDVKACPDNTNLFYIGSKNCELTLWDLRTPNKTVSTYRDTSVGNGEKMKPIMCFDVSPNNRLLTAGSELYEGDAFLLFWDLRNVKMLGGYWQSHTDDVTQVRFHPNDANKLMSSSMDGLINIYDLTQSCEDDSLTDTLNTESSVERLCWYRTRGTDCICCMQNVNAVQLWMVDDVKPYAHFRRIDISRMIEDREEDAAYIATAHTTNDNEGVFLLAGSNAQDGRYLRSLRVKEAALIPEYAFKENRQVVRTSYYNQYANVLVTGGEKGLLNVWDLQKLT